MIRNLIVAASIFLPPVIASAQGVEELRENYLSDPHVSSAVKDAIRKRVVVVGMCPLEAFAAAGLPGPYMVKRDQKKWSADTPPPTIIGAQCASPDDSSIELMFRNTSQFSTSEPTVFRVKFLHGKSVLIDRKGFKEE